MTNTMNVNSNKKAIIKKAVSKALIYAVLVLYAIIIIFPFSVVVLTSFKTAQEAASEIEFSFIPTQGFTFAGYLEVFNFKPNPDMALPGLIQGFINTLIYVLPTTLIGLMVGSLSAYCFAKYKFRGSNIMYSVLIGTMMIPGAIMMVPSYSLYDTLHWIDTPLPLIIPGLFSSAACVFFMRQFFTTIPDSILEAAKLDGMGLLGIFVKIMLPLSVPALIAQGLLGFIGGYNDYLGPLLYLESGEIQTLQIVLSTFASSRERNYPNAVMAATILALLPTLIIYFIAQDFFIEGIAASAIKG